MKDLLHINSLGSEPWSESNLRVFDLKTINVSLLVSELVAFPMEKLSVQLNSHMINSISVIERLSLVDKISLFDRILLSHTLSVNDEVFLIDTQFLVAKLR